MIGEAREGYGADWSLWDLWRRERFADALARLGRHEYGNLEVFRSPRGRWMAFHTDDYADVRIVDLETGETVVTDVYRRGDHYAHTVMLSTYVPTFRKGTEHGRTCWRPVHATGVFPHPAFVEADLWSMPLAFVAWTIWAADHEQYVDALDLSRVDEGIVSVHGRDPEVTTIGAGHVRNYVSAGLTYVLDLVPDADDPTVRRMAGTTGADRGQYVSHVTMLVEKPVGTFKVDMRAKATSFHDAGTDAVLQPRPSLPWEEIRDRSAAGGT